MKPALAVAAVAIALAVPAAVAHPDGTSRFREVETMHVDHSIVHGWRTNILLRNRSQVIGFALYSCVQVTERRQCTVSFVLPEGKIQAQGDAILRGFGQYTLTGGTGTYAGATGIVVVNRPYLTFHFS